MEGCNHELNEINHGRVLLRRSQNALVFSQGPVFDLSSTGTKRSAGPEIFFTRAVEDVDLASL